ncbi:unnamed protein product, partial [Bubo scandiacus]
LVLVAPRLVALGSPVGLLVAAVGPVTGDGDGLAGGGRPWGRTLRPPGPPSTSGPHNDFNQIVNIEVTPEQARRCGVLEAAVGQTLLLEAQSPPLPPRGVRVGLGAPRGVLLIQTDKPLYAPGQTVRFPRLLPGPRPAAEPRTHPGHHQ